MKVKLRLPIEVGKTYYTRDGKEVRVYATDGGYATPIHGAELQREGWVARQWEKDGTHIQNSDSKITHEKWEPQDKELVWFWDDGRLTRGCGFYDAKNNRIFASDDGTRTGSTWEHYAPCECEWPEWAKEAYKKLED